MESSIRLQPLLDWSLRDSASCRPTDPLNSQRYKYLSFVPWGRCKKYDHKRRARSKQKHLQCIQTRSKKASNSSGAIKSPQTLSKCRNTYWIWVLYVPIAQYMQELFSKAIYDLNNEVGLGAAAKTGKELLLLSIKALEWARIIVLLSPASPIAGGLHVSWNRKDILLQWEMDKQNTIAWLKLCFPSQAEIL